jgi:hypothetical protein
MASGEAQTRDSASRRSSISYGLSALILGVMAASGSAGLFWVADWFGVPQVFLLAPALQGVILGSVLAAVVKWLRLRSRLGVAVLGLVCGLVSVGLLHLGQYLHFVNVEAAQQIEHDPNLAQSQKALRRQLYERNHSQYVNATLQEETGYKGFVGYTIQKTRTGFSMLGTRWIGWAVVSTWIIEALLVIGLAMALPIRSVARPALPETDVP